MVQPQTISASAVPLARVRSACWLPWLVAKVCLVAMILAGAVAAGVDADDRSRNLPVWVMNRFAHWDSNLYGAIAVRGYPRVSYPHSYFAFLPGFPWAMRLLGGALGVEVRWAALIIVTVSSLACVMLLPRVIVEMTGSGRAARWGVLAFLFSPMAVFFTVDYTEAPFLGLTLGAWLAGRRRAWVWGAILAALATTLRITGLFVTASLIVMFVARTGERRTRSWSPRPLAFGLGPAFLLGYAIWLHRQTGSWTTWTSAQRIGFGRATSWPWVGVLDTLHKIATADTWHLEVVRLLDLLAAGGSWVVAAHLVRRRWWPEATLTALCAVSMSFSTILDSSPRYLASVFPLYALLGLWLGRASARRRVLYLGASLSLCSFAAVGWGMQWWIA